MNDDAELLRRYVEERSESAFAELVRRHIGLVYASALRRVGGDAHLAEDVTQKVFNDLARKARMLTGRAALSGWLYVGAQHAAAEAVRREQRRKARETEAHTMNETLHVAGAETEIDWDRLRPVLDELILELKEEDREAVALRFFEQRPFAEVGAALRLSEDAARKRVERAVEKLRARLAERGITSTAAAVAFGLGGQAVASVPAALAAQVAGVALAELAAAGAGGSLLATLGGALASKVAAVMAVILGGGALVLWQHRANAALEAEVAALAGPAGELQALERDNLRLARRVTEAERLRRAETEAAAAAKLRVAAPVARAAEQRAAVPPAATDIVVTEKGTLRWGREGQPLTLDEFLRRLRMLHDQHPGADAPVLVRAETGAAFPAVAWVVDEASKSEIKDIAIASAAKPPPGDNWFHPPGPRRPREPNAPPTNGQ
jgi:RNA polymerase sigma factor (sigma-70 family)